MNKANECTCPSGDGSLVHPCPAHPAVEQAGGDERDFQAKGAQEVPSPVSKEYDRHLISLLRKGEALPGHQEEAADEIERLRDWNDHLNNTVLPNILNPNFLMLMKGGERLLDLCTKDGKFIGVSLNDMKDVFDWMVTHARIAPDHAALAQPSPAQAEKAEAERPIVSFEKYMQVMYDRDENAKRLDAALARVAGLETALSSALSQHGVKFMDPPDGGDTPLIEQVYRMSQALSELEKQEPVATIAKVPGEDWNGLHFYRDLQGMQPGTKLYAAPVAQAQQLHDLDKQCRDDVARALGLRPSQGRGFAWSYLLASIKSCVKASEDAAQAQHSVPAYVSYTTRPAESLAGIALRQLKEESRWVEIRDINAPAFPDMQSHSYYPAGTVIKLPAAAPGKSVPQAWLDVQVERRRQVEAEGWTPEHDDEHSHGQMARAAACYALAGSSAPNDGTAALLVSLAWPWDEQWWKPSTARRDMVKAGALILAEIERLDRAAPARR